MKQIIAAVIIALPVSLAAQDEGDLDRGLSLIDEGARLLFQELMGEVEPSLDDFADMAQDLGPALEALTSEMGPALMELLEAIDSINNYSAPEIMPNGDIIIRRNPSAPPMQAAPSENDGYVDL